ncbi:MAG: TolC family protein [Bdellovibrio sp.]|nr:TolC family protein [Bdellovibrio sp.]
MKTCSFLLTLLLGTSAYALEGLNPLEAKLNEKNQTLLALKNDVAAKEQILKSSYATFYPTLDAVAGWGEDRLVDPGDRHKGYFGYLDGRLNIFRGFGDSAISRQKELALDVAKIEHEKKQRELRQQLIDVTSEVIFLHRLQEILVSEANVTKEHRKMAAKKVSSGLTSSVDNLEFDLREEELSIQKRQIAQLHDEAHQKILQLFGEDISEEILDSVQYGSFASLSSIPTYNPEKNLDLQKAQLNLQLAEQEKKEGRAGYLPSVDFVYSFGRLTPTEESSMDFNESRYAVKLTIPLFSGFDTRHKQQAAKSFVQARKAESLQSSNDSRSAYNTLSRKISELSDLYKINERKLETSKKYFEMTVNEYKRGIKNSPDLVTATERWFSSQKRKYEILKELEIAQIKIQNLN